MICCLPVDVARGWSPYDMLYAKVCCLPGSYACPMRLDGLLPLDG